MFSPASVSPPVHRLLERRDEFLAFVRRRIADSAASEDLLQAAYLRALEPGRVPAEPGSAAAWFYSVLRHAVIDYYRRRAAESKGLDRWSKEWNADPNFAEPASPPAPPSGFVCGCIAAVLPRMRPAYAEALREVDLNEGELKVFAQQHELTLGNAAVRLHRARVALRRELQAFCGACTIDACLDCVCKPVQVI